jgi:hypothetical protein
MITLKLNVSPNHAAAQGKVLHQKQSANKLSESLYVQVTRKMRIMIFTVVIAYCVSEELNCQS